MAAVFAQPVVVDLVSRAPVVGGVCHLLGANGRTLCGVGDDWPDICPDFAGEHLCPGCRRLTCADCVRVCGIEKALRGTARRESRSPRRYRPEVRG